LGDVGISILVDRSGPSYLWLFLLAGTFIHIVLNSLSLLTHTVVFLNQGRRRIDPARFVVMERAYLSRLASVAAKSLAFITVAVAHRIRRTLELRSLLPTARARFITVIHDAPMLLSALLGTVECHAICGVAPGVKMTEFLQVWLILVCRDSTTFGASSGTEV
jgi:hypothetical protein